ncbi:MAG: hypothetical protein SGPRY_012258 [Prymnesium sp.]
MYIREQQESDDILQWELDQLEKLKELATVYNWMEKVALYKEHVRLIQEQSVARQVARVTGVADSTKRACSAAPRPARISSVQVAAKRCIRKSKISREFHVTRRRSSND